MQALKQQIISALRTWINQRPGLEFGNYGEMKSYRAEIRQIGKDLQHARALLRAVELRDSITGEMIIEAAKHAYSGRLVIGFTSVCDKCHRDPTLQHHHEPRVVIDYCTGQYWPTEYRRAVCAVLASVMWAYWRDQCLMHAPVKLADGVAKYRIPNSTRYGSAGDYLRAHGRQEFGRSIGERWFN